MDAKTVTSVMIGIIGTGLLLNMVGKGFLGQTAQKAAKYVTEGYGV